MLTVIKLEVKPIVSYIGINCSKEKIQKKQELENDKSENVKTILNIMAEKASWEEDNWVKTERDAGVSPVGISSKHFPGRRKVKL